MLYKKFITNLVVMSLLVVTQINAMEKQESRNHDIAKEEPNLFDQILKIAKDNPHLHAYIEAYPRNPHKISENRENAKKAALADAIKKGIPSTVFALLKKFDDLNFYGLYNPLANAVAADNIIITEILIFAGANVNFKPLRGLSAVVDIKSPRMLNFLLEHGADLSLGSYNDKNLFMQKVEQSDKNTDPELIKALAKHFDINEPLRELTPLMRAVLKRDYDMVKLLLDIGVDPSIRTQKGTALEIANDHGYFEISELLLSTNG